MEIVIFENQDPLELQDEINEWLEKYPDIEPIDIKYSSHSFDVWQERADGFYQEGTDQSFSVLIYYKKQAITDKEVAPDDIPF